MKPKKSNTARALWIRTGVVVIVIAAAATGLIYWRVTSSRVYVDSASIEAPLIDLAPSAPGTLEDVYVKVGDEVNQNAVVARVGNELVTTQEAGIIVSVPANIGAQVSPQQPVATMIDPTQLRVVGEVDEDKGLDRIQVGDKVVFTVDAFGSKQYSAIVDEISPTSQQSQIVFNISDQREEQQVPHLFRRAGDVLRVVLG